MDASRSGLTPSGLSGILYYGHGPHPPGHKSSARHCKDHPLMSSAITTVRDRWSAAETAGLSDLDTLVYLSRLLGSDPQLVLWGGGNTSLKTTESDFRGLPTDVLRI